MKERGQVFTIDMLFALILVTLVIGYSGQALELVTQQTEDYSARYSLERVANDAADVLVKTSGRPEDWENRVADLETPGLAFTSHRLSMRKFDGLRHLCATENWDTDLNAVQAVMKLFDNSQNFEIRLIDENTGENLWPPIYPRWDSKTTSGAEDSLEVVVVKRLVAIGDVDIKEERRGILRIAGPPRIYHLDFEVGSGELDSLDWYIVLRPSTRTQPVVKIWVNREAVGEEESWDYHFPNMKPPSYGPEEPIYQPTYQPRYHGEDGVGARSADDFVPLHEGTNYIEIRISGEEETVDVFIVVLQRCSPPSLTLLGEFCTLEVKLWR